MTRVRYGRQSTTPVTQTKSQSQSSFNKTTSASLGQWKIAMDRMIKKLPDPPFSLVLSSSSNTTSNTSSTLLQVQQNNSNILLTDQYE